MWLYRSCGRKADVAIRLPLWKSSCRSPEATTSKSIEQVRSLTQPRKVMKPLAFLKWFQGFSMARPPSIVITKDVVATQPAFLK